MSSPRFEPWLMPETMRSAVKPSMSPSAAKRTQSTGGPAVAEPTVPSPKVTSSTQIGRRVVIERAVADRLESGAITASSTPSISTSARRSAWSPSAPIPSSLVRRTRSTAAEDSCGSARPVSARARGAPLLDRAGLVAPHRRHEPLRPVVVHDREADAARDEQAEEANGHHEVVDARVGADEVGDDAGADEHQGAE